MRNKELKRDAASPGCGVLRKPQFDSFLRDVLPVGVVSIDSLADCALTLG
jgi:hypothetical protein